MRFEALEEDELGYFDTNWGTELGKLLVNLA